MTSYGGAAYAVNTVYANTVTVHGVTGSYVLYTPKVLAFAKTYFSCTTLTFTPLENQGAISDLGNHWEKTMFHTDLMTANFEDTDAKFSGFDTALLEDTGFYAFVDTTKAEQIFFGKGRGCTFITGSDCNTGFSEYCPTAATESCDFNAQIKSTCSNSDVYMDTANCKINKAN